MTKRELIDRINDHLDAALERADCTHADLYWYAAPADEKGWRCASCDWRPGEDPGYSPEHDRSHIVTKVCSVLHDLHDAGIIYVSNSSGGESITASVARRCVDEKLYDSVSIARLILEIEGGERHAAFWRHRGEGIVAGNDPRRRCDCGALANIYTDGKSFCSEHVPPW